MPGRRNAAPDPLSKRERQVMDVIYRRKAATAAEVFADLPDAASYNAVRSILNILEEKGHLTHQRRDRRYVYEPTVAPARARRSALAHVVETLFAGSATQLVRTLIDQDRTDEEELEKLERLIRAARAARRSSRR